MTNKTDDVIVKQVEQDVLIEGLTKQLQNIDDKLDKLIKTINDNHEYHLKQYNKLSERVTILETGKQQTRYLIGLVGIILVGLEFLLKYVI